MVECRGRDRQYRLTKQFNPTGANDDQAMVLLYGALTRYSADQNHYDALVKKPVSELTKDDI